MMRVLISAIHFPVSAARYLADGFRRLGHDVTTIGAAMGGYLPWQPDTDFSAYAWTPDIEVPNERIFWFNEIIDYDLVIQCDANFFLGGITECPNVCWAVDNHVAPYADTHFNLFFGAHSWGYHSQDENFHWLPCAYAPQAHFQIKDAVKRFDAVLIGNMYPARQELVNALAPFGSILIGQGVLGEKYNDSYNAARIALVSSACGDVPMRLFENAAQGLCLMCDRQKDLDRLGLRDGEHYIGYSNLQEAVNVFRGMKDTRFVETIAESGKEALARHTYEVRAQEIIDTCKAKGLL